LEEWKNGRMEDWRIGRMEDMTWRAAVPNNMIFPVSFLAAKLRFKTA
jgi:hypothetical protein